MRFRPAHGAALSILVLSVANCDYVRLLRPSVVRQLDPDVARLVNYLPSVDNPNEAIVARLFAHGGLSHAHVGEDGIMRDQVRVPKNQFIWKPAVIVAPRVGEIEIEFQNEDQHFHMALLPSVGDRRLLELPLRSAGLVRIRLDHPGLYWFGCPVANHAGRGMIGIIIVEGETPPEARLDRPVQRRK